MTSISLAEAQANFVELVRNLRPGEQIIIMDGDRPLGTVTGLSGKDAPLRLDESLEDSKD